MDRSEEEKQRQAEKRKKDRKEEEKRRGRQSKGKVGRGIKERNRWRDSERETTGTGLSYGSSEDRYTHRYIQAIGVHVYIYTPERKIYMTIMSVYRYI